MADLTSWCEGLKEEGVVDREEVHRLRAEVLGLKAEADHHEEVLRQAQDGLKVATEERISLAKSLDDERSVGRALNARIESSE